jgi:hypothetical protein
METEIVEVFWRAYQGLRKKERQQVASRILMDQNVSEDWIDHVLIERARNEPGKDVSLDNFLARQK